MFLRRVAPAWALVVLSPLIAEFLLGDFPLRRLALLVPFMAMYGCAALLIREVVRRAGGGWPMLLVLALTYGVLEEGVFTMSLFNNDYVGQHLLTYGFVPALGTSPVWAVYVLTLHVVWSIATPVAIAEGLSGVRARTPWLKLPGLIVAAVLFVLGAGAATITQIGSSHFVAAPGQLVAVGVIVVGLIAVAVALGRRGPRRQVPTATVRPVTALGVVAFGFVIAMAVQAVELFLSGAVPAVVTTLGMLVLEAIAVAVITRWTGRGGFGAAQVGQLAIGTTASYGIYGVWRMATGQAITATGPVDVVSQVVLAVVLIAVAVLAVRRAAAVRTEPDAHALSSSASTVDA